MISSKKTRKRGNTMKKLLALMLCCVMLCGCTANPLLDLYGITPFEEMEYTRPDMDAVAKSCQDAIAAAEQSDDVDEILDAVWGYYDVYDEFTTNYDLAYIHYHANLGDIYWKAEHDFCAENAAQLDMYLEDLYYALAECPLRAGLEEEYFGEGFFLDYEGEGFYDENLVALMEREQALVSEYYDMTDEAEEEYYSEEYFDAWAGPMADVLAELIEVRQEIADYAGFGSYTDFAWDYYYYRDYTPAQASAYLEEIRTALVPLYESMNAMDVWAPGDEACSEKEVFQYVKTAAKSMGGITEEAFQRMELGGLCDISASPDKSGMSFELFLSWYYEPYVFVSGTGTGYDKLTFAHEFGHFANDYAAGGSWAGTDVMEIFSQGMEYMSLCYADADQDFIDMKLADSLSTYVEQAAYAVFEQEMYGLTGEELTGENLLDLYGEICRAYGFESMDWDPRDLVTIPHFYSNPMYIISYVVSNDAAMQLYEMELENPGAGKESFEDNLTTEESFFLAFLEEAGLESPFDRVEKVRALMAERFGK